MTLIREISLSENMQITHQPLGASPGFCFLQPFTQGSLLSKEVCFKLHADFFFYDYVFVFWLDFSLPPAECDYCEGEPAKRRFLHNDWNAEEVPELYEPHCESRNIEESPQHGGTIEIWFWNWVSKWMSPSPFEWATPLLSHSERKIIPSWTHIPGIDQLNLKHLERKANELHNVWLDRFTTKPRNRTLCDQQNVFVR